MHPRPFAMIVALVLLCTSVFAHAEPLLLAGSAESLELVCGMALVDAAAGADTGDGRSHVTHDGLGDALGVLPGVPAAWPPSRPTVAWCRGRAAAIPLPPYLDGLQRPPCRNALA